MKPARVTAYAAIISFMIGTGFGVAMSMIDLPFLNQELYYKVVEFNRPERTEGSLPLSEQFDLSHLTIDRGQLARGGPAKDGIPALNAEVFVSVDHAYFLLNPDDRIIAVAMNGEARAYPIRLLNRHEIVNDELGGVPIAVVYCPLCDSVTVVDRRVNGETLTFGVSGLLYQSNVLMFDREHDALWSQILFEAISGPYAGRSLRHYSNWAITTFEQWKQANPEATVVMPQDGTMRRYDRNPYEGYLTSDELYFPVKRDDDRLEKKTRVIGLRFGDVVRAYPVDAVHRAPDGRLIDTIAGERLVLEADPDTGHTAVLEAPEESQVIHTLWFSWAASHPRTELYDANN